MLKKIDNIRICKVIDNIAVDKNANTFIKENDNYRKMTEDEVLDLRVCYEIDEIAKCIEDVFILQ